MQIEMSELKQLVNPSVPSASTCDYSKECGVQIVILQRGWVVVGYVTRSADEVIVEKAAVIRTWGTTKGIGELAGGPTNKTVLDKCGTVRTHPMCVVATVDCDKTGWKGVL